MKRRSPTWRYERGCERPMQQSPVPAPRRSQQTQARMSYASIAHSATSLHEKPASLPRDVPDACRSGSLKRWSPKIPGQDLRSEHRSADGNAGFRRGVRKGGGGTCSSPRRCGRYHKMRQHRTSSDHTKSHWPSRPHSLRRSQPTPAAYRQKGGKGRLHEIDTSGAAAYCALHALGTVRFSWNSQSRQEMKICRRGIAFRDLSRAFTIRVGLPHFRATVLWWWSIIFLLPPFGDLSHWCNLLLDVRVARPQSAAAMRCNFGDGTLQRCSMTQQYNFTLPGPFSSLPPEATAASSKNSFT